MNSSESNSAAISAEALRAPVLEALRAHGKVYRKTRPVRARLARRGERVQTVTSNGMETENTAGEGDMVVENQTEARERYLVSADMFRARYVAADDDAGERAWREYLPRGRVLGVAVDPALCRALGVKAPFLIIAPWGTPQRLALGDYLVTPSEAPSDDADVAIYGIANTEFRETYEALEAE